jgi:uncharacterized protein YdeI (YjbR/CyaY-like superfamily)
LKEKLFKTAAAWRAWLERNHDRGKELWLVYYKKGTGKKSVTYEEALNEALCFGWIDSTVNKLDHERYRQKWTPRNIDSIWSSSNKARVKKLMAGGRMAAPGLAKIEAAKRNGSWNKLNDIDRIGRTAEIPDDLRAALATDPVANEKWERLAPSHKKLWAWWILSAKKPETRTRRIGETLKRVAAGRRPGM